MRWCAWCLSRREIWQTPCSGMVACCLILSHLDTLQLKRDRLDGPLMTRMMFWLCKEREISRSSHRSRHMSCHWRQNNQYQVSSKDPLGCHEAGGAPWVLETFWYIPGIAWCSLQCPHQFKSNTYVVLHSPVPYLLRDGLCADGLDTPLEIPLVWLTSVLSGAFHRLLIVHLWSPSIFSLNVVLVFFDATSLVVWVDTPSLGWGPSACCPSVSQSMASWRQCSLLVYPVWFPVRFSPGSG